MKKKIKKRKLNSSVIVFSLFSLFAFLLVIALEYFDFRQGNPTFFFPKPQESAKKSKKDSNDVTASSDWSIFLSSSVELVDRFVDKQNIEHLKLRISNSEINSLRNKLRQFAAQKGSKLTLVETSKNNTNQIFLYHIFHNFQKTHIILIYSVNIEQKTQEKRPLGKSDISHAKPTKSVAIIIDDIGNRPGIIEKLKTFSIPMTASILVDEPYAGNEVSASLNTSIETILHIPMEAINETKNSNPNTITTRSTTQQMSMLIKKSKEIVPFAKGVNNHQGSLATASPPTMKRFLSILQENNLFFVDSRTNSDSVGYTLAQEMGVKSVYKDMFIDHIPTLEHSREQFNRLYDLLKKKNTAVLIGHPHESTFQAIREAIPKLKQMNVVFVHASDLVH